MIVLTRGVIENNIVMSFLGLLRYFLYKVENFIIFLCFIKEIKEVI